MGQKLTDHKQRQQELNPGSSWNRDGLSLCGMVHHQQASLSLLPWHPSRGLKVPAESAHREA